MKWTENLRALFPCANESCGETQTYEAADLFWFGGDSDFPEGWYCVNCLSQGEPPGDAIYANSLYIFLTRSVKVIPTNAIHASDTPPAIFEGLSVPPNNPSFDQLFGSTHNAVLSQSQRSRLPR